MAYVVKVIKPKRLQADAVRLEILTALHQEGRLHVRELKKTVESWHDKPRFDYAISLAGGNISVLSEAQGTGDGAKHWNWIDQGVPGRTIYAKRAPYLRFKYPYWAATKPRFFGSYPAGTGSNWARKKSVQWPGIKARLWTQTLQDKRKRPFQQAVTAAVKRGSAKLFP